MRTCIGCQFYQDVDGIMKPVCNQHLRNRYGCKLFAEPNGVHVIVYTRKEENELLR
jgi:hypothetical protein